MRRFLLLVSALTLVGCGSSELSLTGRIALSNDSDNGWSIAIFDVEEGTVRGIFDNQAFDWGPAFSPDGTQIAFTSEYVTGEIADLLIFDENNVPSRVVREIVGDRDIFVVQADGSNPVRLTDNMTSDEQPSWSPDGHNIAFVSDRTGDVEIFSMGAGGENAVQLTDSPGEDWNPNWSPDGDQIAFASRRTGNWEIHVMDADGANVRQFSDHPADDQKPVWSPDGDQILFGSNRTGDYEIYVANTQDGEVRQLTYSPGTDFEPVWSPDGTLIAFASARAGQLEVFVMTADGDNETRLKLPGLPSSWANN